MKRLARGLRWSALALLGTALVALASALLALAAVGVFATAAPAWTSELRILGAGLRVNVVGLVRLATLPGLARLLDGHQMPTPNGRLALTRAGDALRVRCAPCRFEHAALSSGPVQLRSAVLEVTRIDERLDGTLSLDGVPIRFSARLRSGAIDIDWKMPSTELAHLYTALVDAVPEAAYARIEGSVTAEGTLSLPSRRATVRWSAEGLEVGGLGTEPLQYGTFRFACPTGDGATRLAVSGDGEPAWIAEEAAGPYLAAAVLAAEDQRFHQHAGFDEAAVAALLADMEDGRPVRGASTVTQQLARTLFTGGERTVARKMRELLYALEMERTLGKPRILALYLNTVHWGPGVCGAKAAARAYFGKAPARLTAIEAAWLAGALRDPQRAWSDEFASRRPDAVRAGRVVNEMRDWSRHERRRFAAQPLAFATGPRATRR